jgi:phosphatidylserine/phosphatidylglycerophosphate/cardiolipin synthase-like enzyme
VDHINTFLANGAAILDNRVLQVAAGTHHQKMLIVKGSEGLIGFCGGIDINPDRIHTVGATPGAPFHDVHCRIKGPGAHELLKVFLERWTDHPDSKKPGTKQSAPLRGANDDPRSASVRRTFAGSAYVQISRTYGSGLGNAGVPGGYDFARSGERTSREMVVHAINQAKRFIYIEDQYLVSMDVSGALARALQRVPSLIVIILIPHGDVTAMGGQTRWRRWNFIEPLRRAGPAGPAGQQRFGVFFLGTRACAPGTYVHTKMTIVDDQYAIVGSANLNRRSMTHDSEVGAGIFDPSENPFAKRLRVALWAKHLGLAASSLGDAVASARHWFSLRPGTAAGGGVCVYQENVNVRPPRNEAERIERDILWSQIDPDGR